MSDLNLKLKEKESNKEKDDNQLQVVQEEVNKGLVESLKNAITELIQAQLQKVLNRVSNAENKALEADNKAEKALAINDTGQLYLNQTELGKLYKPSMSSHTIGNVLRLIRWAKSSKTHRTEPYESIQKLRAKMLDFNYYRYHKEKFKEDFEDWLTDNNLWDDFSKHISKKQRQQFFKKLHNKIIE